VRHALPHLRTVDRYPYTEDAPVHAAGSAVCRIQGTHARIGVERAVIVNATPYGRD